MAAPPSARTIVITGMRSERELDDEPYSVAVIDQQELERELPRTLPEALDDLAGVLVQKTASGHGSPYIRGFTGNRTLLVIDGVRYNNATYRDGANEYFAQIDSFTLAQIELVFGPASALFGSEAVGGTLNLVTRDTGYRERGGSYLGGEQTIRVSSGDRSVVSRTALSVGKGGKWGVRGGFTLRDYDDIRAAEFGRLPYTGYDESAFDVRGDVALGPVWTLTATHQSLYQTDVPRTHATVFSVPFEGTVVGDDLLREKDHRRGLNYVKLSGDIGAPLARTLEVTVSHQGRREEETRIRANRQRIEQSFDSDVWGLSLVASAGERPLEVTYGADLTRENIDSERRDIDPLDGSATIRLQGPVGDDATYDQTGIFARAIGQLGGGLSLEGGVRLSHVRTRIGQFADPVTGNPRSFSGDWSDMSGSARLRYEFADHAIWAAYSRSFRAPNIADLSRFGNSRSNEIEIASPGLRPEKFDTFEIAYRQSSQTFSWGATAYVTKLIDYIDTVPTGRMRDGLVEVAKQNAARGTIHGIELSGRIALGEGFGVESNVTWLRGRLDSPTVSGIVREPISRIQPITANLAATWEGGSSWLRADLQIAGRADELSSGDRLDRERIPPGGTPGFVLIGLRGGTEITSGIEASLALENLLDETYRAHGSGNNEPGRHVVAALSLRF